jgi:hypothetical protein
MPADQAAGLRRRAASQPVRCIYFFAGSAASSVQLAHALHQIGQVLLLVDTQGRLFSASSPRSLFDWRHQLERQQLHTLPQAYGDGWYAPGMRADEPALSGMADAYDYVMFDSGLGGADLALLPGAAHTVVMEVCRTDESVLHAYAVLKTLAGSGGAFCVYLLGDRGACEQARAAACHFLGQRFAHAIFSMAKEDDAFAALAGRMAGEETSLTACSHKTGNT